MKALAMVSAGLLSVAASAQTVSSGHCAVRTPTLQTSYVGECLGGVASGRGRAAGMDRYEGEFRDGQPNGFGVYLFPDGRRYEGQFVDGRVNGRARYYFANGDMLEGAFRDNRLVGAGRVVRANGEQLAVEWRDNAFVPVPMAALAPSAGPATPAPATPGPVRAADWSPRLDFEDLFPAYILAVATRGAPDGRRAVDVPRGDPLALDDGTLHAVGEAARAPARSRYAGQRPDARYLGDPWGMVGIRYRNTTPGAKVLVRVVVDDIADPTEAEFTLPEAGEYQLYPRLRYRYDRLRAIGQPMPVNLSWSVSVDGQPAGTQTGVARVRSVQDAPFVLRTERGVENLSWVFAAFVTEEAPWIDTLLKEAFDGLRIGAIGYQAGEAEVLQQVEAVYEYLRRRGFRYSSITTTSGGSERVFSQTVRFPSDSVRTSQANCIDGTVLMASILRRIGIEPLILLGPGHAMLGFYPQADRSKGFYALETTALESGDFKRAVASGMATYRGWAEKHADSPAFQQIAVVRARKEGVMPIAR